MTIVIILILRMFSRTKHLSLVAEDIVFFLALDVHLQVLLNYIY